MGVAGGIHAASPATIYNAAISACAKIRQWHHAIVLLATMQADHLPLNVISCNAVLDTPGGLALAPDSRPSGGDVNAHLVPDVIVYPAAIGQAVIQVGVTLETGMEETFSARPQLFMVSLESWAQQ